MSVQPWHIQIYWSWLKEQKQWATYVIICLELTEIGNSSYLGKIILEGENFRGARTSERRSIQLNCSSSDIILTNFNISFLSQLKKKKKRALGRFRHLDNLSWAFNRSVQVPQVINKAGGFLTAVLLIALWSTLPLSIDGIRSLYFWLGYLNWLPIVCNVATIQSMQGEGKQSSN